MLELEGKGKTCCTAFGKTLSKYLLHTLHTTSLKKLVTEFFFFFSGYKNSGTKNRRMDLYVKEHEHVRNSDRLVSDQISIAMETREHLVSQRHHFKRLQSRLHDLSSRFPALNTLVQKINMRKKRDSFIVGGVVVICTFLILLYTFH